MRRRELRRRIRAKFDTMDAFAEVVGVTRQTISNTLAGKSTPSPTTMECIRKALDVEPEEFYTLMFPEAK